LYSDKALLNQPEILNTWINGGINIKKIFKFVFLIREKLRRYCGFTGEILEGF